MEIVNSFAKGTKINVRKQVQHLPALDFATVYLVLRLSNFASVQVLQLLVLVLHFFKRRASRSQLFERLLEKALTVLRLVLKQPRLLHNPVQLRERELKNTEHALYRGVFSELLGKLHLVASCKGSDALLKALRDCCSLGRGEALQG